MQKRYLVTLTVGIGLDQNGKPIDPATLPSCETSIAAHASELFGGATITRGRGVWLSPGDGRLFDESCLVVSSVSTMPLVETDNGAAALADTMKRALNQDCVLYTRQEVQSAFI